MSDPEPLDPEEGKQSLSSIIYVSKKDFWSNVWGES